DTSFTATIPAQKAGTTVRYYISARSKLGHITTELPGFVTGMEEGAPVNMAGVKDADDAEEVVFADIDITGLEFGHDADNFYLGFSVEGEPGAGNMADKGAYAYFIPMLNLNENRSSADLYKTPTFMFSPMAASLLGLPKYGIVNLSDLGSGKKPQKDPDVKMKKGEHSLTFRFPKDRLGDDFSKGIELIIFTSAIKGLEGGPVLWDASPFLTVYPRHHELTVAAAADVSPAPLRAGAAQADITPPVGTPLTGYAGRTGKPSTGVHDPLEAQALVMESGGEKYLIVTIDTLYIMRRFYIEVAREIERSLGIPREHMIFAASHSHASSGALFPELGILGGLYNENVNQEFVKKHIELIKEAHANLAPARVGSATADATGLSSNRREAGGPVDPEVNVIRIDGTDGKPMAVFFNFTAHPTFLGGDNMEFSADYVGSARTAIEEAFPGAVALFANGAIGNQAPACPGDCKNGFETVEIAGGMLGKKVVEAASNIKTSDKAIFAMTTEDPVLSPAIGFRTTMSALRIGDACMVTNPGELFVELGLEVKEAARAFGCGRSMVVGLANDGIGYIIPEEWYHKHVYEAMFSIFGPKEGDFIKDRMIALANEVAF
ncbi:MAG: neutral/alkaline non-lysosomal ceramidase N-terminal domain-containing protein, partial [bacterium]